MPKDTLVATFDDPHALLGAVPPVRAASFRIHDVYAPFPIHGLDEALGLRRTRLPLVTLLVGLMGLTLAITFQYYANVLDWPLNVGGKPNNSTLAFIPICFELTVLLGGLATVAALFVRTRLYPAKREALPAAGVTDDRFALVLRRPSEPADVARAKEILSAHGALEVEERETAQ